MIMVITHHSMFGIILNFTRMAEYTELSLYEQSCEVELLHNHNSINNFLITRTKKHH